MSEAVSIVLVHGAWADGSSWAEVIRPLQAKDYGVLAAPIPLTSLTDDVAALDRVIGRTEEGPVILVAHAYAGAAISASTNKRVKLLVFVAALTPDEGETVADASNGTMARTLNSRRRRSWPSSKTRRSSRGRWRRISVMSTRPWPVPPARSRRPTKFPSWHTRRWSR